MSASADQIAAANMLTAIYKLSEQGIAPRHILESAAKRMLPDKGEEARLQNLLRMSIHLSTLEKCYNISPQTEREIAALRAVLYRPRATTPAPSY